MCQKWRIFKNKHFSGSQLFRTWKISTIKCSATCFVSDLNVPYDLLNMLKNISSKNFPIVCINTIFYNTNKFVMAVEGCSSFRNVSNRTTQQFSNFAYQFDTIKWLVIHYYKWCVFCVPMSFDSNGWTINLKTEECSTIRLSWTAVAYSHLRGSKFWLNFKSYFG